ncbi:helix-turn-helix domain-containing protein [Streptomyces sp. NPDC059352]|uniref:helix-turn-helix domain-containing protein n=1 Tax=Streptomyces sp. NPDC059352 TaxID=3346810 RepID=UPI0036ADD85E
MAARTAEIGPAGRHVGQAIARLRDARGWDQHALVARLAAEGLAVSQPILSRIEAGTRRVDADELLALAVALDASVIALLPPSARSGAEQLPEPDEPDIDEGLGPVGTALAEDIEQLGDLGGMEPTLAATAVRLARHIDGQRPVPCDECGALVRLPVDPRTLPQLARELRATVAALVEGRTVDDDDDDGLDDLGDV